MMTRTKNFSSFMDLTGQNRVLTCKYYGATNVNLEGRILREEGQNLVVGVSLWKDDIISHQYDSARYSLAIWYRRQPGVRIALLPMSSFEVPKDIKEINVYDAGEKA